MAASTASFQKQSLYRRYAQGELSLDDVMSGVRGVRPATRSVSAARRILGVVVSVLVAFLVPFRKD